MTEISEWSYVYGAGSRPNRKIQFIENGGVVSAVFSTYHIDDVLSESRRRDRAEGARFGLEPRSARRALCKENGWIVRDTLREDIMFASLLSSREKVNLIMDARSKGVQCEYPESIPFTEMDRDKKIAILKQLDPVGPWRVSIGTSIGRNPRHEDITNLNFYDPT